MWLRIQNGHERGKSIRVEGKLFVVGRDDESDLTLADSKVSRRHVALEERPDGGWSLRDLGSSNGTYVNGTRVESATLRGSEQIQLGDTVLVSFSEEPGKQRNGTVIGSLAGLAGGERPSAVYRMLMRRSRRATALGIAALALAVVAVALLAGILLSTSDSSAVEQVIKDATPSTVLVETLDGGTRVESGSGWVLDAGEGLIVTNAHVIGGGTEFRVGAQPATVVGAAPCEDLAVLKVSDTSGLRALPLGDQSSLELGETVVAVGYPENASQEASLTSTTGVVSVIRSAYRDPAADVPRYPNVVQTDAVINPGNSGGPLLDLDGRLVGVTSARRTASADGRSIEGQNYAIGIDRVKTIVAVLRRGRSLGWSGASFEYTARGLVAGPAVPGTGADRAGLMRGSIILAVNGVPVSGSLPSYCDAAAGLQTGGRIALSVLEPGSRAAKTLKVPLS